MSDLIERVGPGESVRVTLRVGAKGMSLWSRVAIVHDGLGFSGVCREFPKQLTDQHKIAYGTTLKPFLVQAVKQARVLLTAPEFGPHCGSSARKSINPNVSETFRPLPAHRKKTGLLTGVDSAPDNGVHKSPDHTNGTGQVQTGDVGPPTPPGHVPCDFLCLVHWKTKREALQ
ncbi:hypothetical protein TNIN_64371 [Trichonephila inaurata madagascariensis]|uniref:Uncharacterized protein n=1 Tax=Trichonephila inaurata madagascariensis TaxID=2747483 RepID=A0A8X6WYF8_9ARAC|nr:hypothetical protein TNIN_64371 [Trichonephila inaurata madagascariensis]